MKLIVMINWPSDDDDVDDDDDSFDDIDSDDGIRQAAESDLDNGGWGRRRRGDDHFPTPYLLPKYPQNLFSSCLAALALSFKDKDPVRGCLKNSLSGFSQVRPSYRWGTVKCY